MLIPTKYLSKDNSKIIVKWKSYISIWNQVFKTKTCLMYKGHRTNDLKSSTTLASKSDFTIEIFLSLQKLLFKMVEMYLETQKLFEHQYLTQNEPITLQNERTLVLNTSQRMFTKTSLITPKTCLAERNFQTLHFSSLMKMIMRNSKLTDVQVR